MKFLLVSPDWFPYSGGLSQTAMEFAQELIKYGHEVTIATAGRKGLDYKGMNVVEVPLLFTMIGRNPICYKVRKTIKQHAKDVDAIFLFSYMFELNSRIAILKKLGCIKKPLIQYYVGSLESYSQAQKNIHPVTRFAKWLWDVTLARTQFRWVDGVVSNSKPTLDVMKKRYGMPKKMGYYVKTGMHVKDYKQSKLNNKRALFVGRLIDNKGVKHFEQIVKSLPNNWKFTIVGNGPLEDYVKELTKRYKQIEYKGVISHTQVKKILSKTDINILPTYAEGSPRSTLEASCSGVPSICFDVGDVINTIPKGTGYVIKRYDIKDFCDKVKKLSNDTKLIKTLGKNARIFAEKEFDWKQVYKKNIIIIKNIIKNKKRN